MNHGELVERAARWLANSQGCAVVVTELAGGAEEPDAIGWNGGGGSILIECKVSKTDFLADKLKYSRRLPELGIGDQRYYFVPPALAEYALDHAQVDWGICKVYPRKVVTVRKPGDIPLTKMRKWREISMLVSLLRRVAGIRKPLRGANIKCYTIDDSQDPRATLGIELIEGE